MQKHKIKLKRQPSTINIQKNDNQQQTYKIKNTTKSQIHRKYKNQKNNQLQTYKNKQSTIKNKYRKRYCSFSFVVGHNNSPNNNGHHCCFRYNNQQL